MRKDYDYPLRKRLLFILLIGLAPYWLMNATVWIPWVFLSKTVGITIMVTSAPIFWGYASYYCYKHIEKQYWKLEQWLISIIFLIASVLSDLFFFYIWRNLSFDELYHPSTFASYGLIVIMPFIVKKIADILYSKGKIKVNLLYNWWKIICFDLMFFVVTLYCVRYW